MGTGRKPGFFHTEETRQKMRRPHKNRKIVLEKYIELFYEKNLPTKAIAEHFGVATQTIASFRVLHKLPRRGHSVPPWLGKKHSALTIEKIKKSRTGKCSRERNPNWKGGRYISHHGYVIVRVSDDHPFTYKGYIREHRFVMEKKLGRFLKPEEQVHHINGIKTDNRIENLMLFESNSAHKRFENPAGSKFGKNTKISH